MTSTSTGEEGTAVSAHPDPQTCTVLYKILTVQEKEALPKTGWKGTAFDQNDGFIHLSTAHQLAGTLQRFFSPEKAGNELVLMALPRANIDNPDVTLKFEPAAGTLFGHIYGTIDPSTAFVHEYTLQRGHDGQFTLESLPF